MIKNLQKLLLVILLMMFMAPAKAQNAIAKLKYEQAEEAFIKNDYRTTLTRLDEAQKLLGSSNPKILYLRLMADKGIIAGGKYDYDFLAAARKDAGNYLKEYSEVQGIEEKFREVYEFSEALEKLPATKVLFEQKEAEAAQRMAEWVKARPIQVSDSLMTAYRVKKCATVKEFEDYNLRAFIGLTKYKHQTKEITSAYINNWNQNSIAGPLQILFNDKGLYVYSYTVLGETDPATAKKVYQSLIDLYPAGMDKEAAVRKEITTENGHESGHLAVLPPATGNRGNIAINYMNINGKANVIISFAPQHQ